MPDDSNFLTLEEKKAHHNALEQRRRQQIRQAFDHIVQIVPELDPKHLRLEMLILEKLTARMEELRADNQRLLAVLAQRGQATSTAEVARELTQKHGVLLEGVVLRDTTP